MGARKRVITLEASVSAHYVKLADFLVVIAGLKPAITRNLPADPAVTALTAIDDIIEEHLYGHEKAA
jgi:hypothetical protein